MLFSGAMQLSSQPRSSAEHVLQLRSLSRDRVGAMMPDVRGYESRLLYRLLFPSCSAANIECAGLLRPQGCPLTPAMLPWPSPAGPLPCVKSPKSMSAPWQSDVANRIAGATLTGVHGSEWTKPVDRISFPGSVCDGPAQTACGIASGAMTVIAGSVQRVERVREQATYPSACCRVRVSSILVYGITGRGGWSC